MKVYVVLQHYPFSGPSEPKMVYDTEEKAKEYCDTNKNAYTFLDYYELEVEQ